MAVRSAMSHYAKKVPVGRHITTGFVNSFILLCKYIDSIGQEPCHAKIRKRVPAKGIASEVYLRLDRKRPSDNLQRGRLLLRTTN